MSLPDAISLVRRFIHFLRSNHPLALKLFWQSVILAREPPSKRSAPEHASLIQEPTEFEQMELLPPSPHRSQSEPDTPTDFTTQWANNVRNHRHSHSGSSDATLFDLQSPTSKFSQDTRHDFAYDVQPKVPLFKRLAAVAFLLAEYSAVLAGFGLLLTGIVVYTGACRENYINGCMAHLISMS